LAFRAKLCKHSFHPLVGFNLPKQIKSQQRAGAASEPFRPCQGPRATPPEARGPHTRGLGATLPGARGRARGTIAQGRTRGGKKQGRTLGRERGGRGRERGGGAHLGIQKPAITVTGAPRAKRGKRGGRGMRERWEEVVAWETK
jgi:hypothetical protein